MSPTARVLFLPTSGRWPLLQDSWGPVSCLPSSSSWPALPGLPWGSVLAVRARSGRLYTAPRHVRVPGLQLRVPATAPPCGCGFSSRGAPRRGCAPVAPLLHVLPAPVLDRCEAPLRASTGSGARGRRPCPLAPYACLGRSMSN